MSKIDCNITENYFKEKTRLCKEYRCSTCPLNKDMPSYAQRCFTREMKNIEEAIAIVQKWSDEHPVKTIKDDFLEKYPKARMDVKDVPIICVNHLGYCVECSDICSDCWNRPLSEVQK